MSQAVEPPPAGTPRPNEFDYRPVPVLAPVSLVLGICSALGLLALFGVILALVATVVSLVSFVQIRRAAGELGGTLLAGTGLLLSTVFLASGSTLYAYKYATEVPEGHRRVSFPYDISRKQFLMEGGRRKLHPDVVPLVDEKIFIKGYMWNRRQQDDLESFVLLKDNGKCCFGGDPAPWDMIFVEMEPGKTVDYTPGLVAVGGLLRANPAARYGEPVYTIEATHFGQAKTSF